MKKTSIIESKDIDMNTHQANYKIGNSVFVVESHFAGKERLEDLIFELLKSKSAAQNAKIPFKA